jgi:hypothetical protein
MDPHTDKALCDDISEFKKSLERSSGPEGRVAVALVKLAEEVIRMRYALEDIRVSLMPTPGLRERGL